MKDRHTVIPKHLTDGQTEKQAEDRRAYRNTERWINIKTDRPQTDIWTYGNRQIDDNTDTRMGTLTVNICPQDFPWAQAIFHCISLLYA